MGKILVFAEQQNGNLKRSALELLSAARATGKEIAACIVGSNSNKSIAGLKEAGAGEIHVLSGEQFAKYNPEVMTAALNEVISKTGSNVILASASSLGKDLFPRVAARLKSGLISDCTKLEISGDDVHVIKPVYSGKSFAKMQFENSPVKIVLMRANQLQIDAAKPAAQSSIVEHTKAFENIRTVVKDVVKGASEKLDLTEANIIVSGGRGLKEAGNFKILEELANVLGATVGASRAVVDAGWIGHGSQVGQTGKTVAPSLYIAVGISGAIQHLAGMSGSKVIVAINNDPNAPIFQKATYGIVGDLFEVIPLLTEEFRKVLK